MSDIWPFAPSAANPYNFLKFIRKINVKYLMNNNKNSIIDNNIIDQMLYQ